jgi:hypothetical protein
VYVDVVVTDKKATLEEVVVSQSFIVLTAPEITIYEERFLSTKLAALTLAP